MLRKVSFIFIIIGLLALVQGCVVMDYTAGGYQYKEYTERSFKHVNSVNLDNFQGNVLIEPATDGKIKIQSGKILTGENEDRLRDVAKKVVIDYHDGSNSLVIKTERPEPRPSGVQSMSVDFRMYIPADIQVSVRTANGSIQVTGMRDKVFLHSSNGSITIEDLVGDLQAKTSNGAINLNRVIGNINLESSNGRLQLNDVKGEIEAETSNGGIQIETAQLVDRLDLRTSNSSIKFRGKTQNEGRYEMETSNGAIDIYVNKKLGYDLYAKTSNGRIQFTFPIKFAGTFEKDYINGKIENGGASLVLKTSNGGITIHEMEEN